MRKVHRGHKRSRVSRTEKARTVNLQQDQSPTQELPQTITPTDDMTMRLPDNTNDTSPTRSSRHWDMSDPRASQQPILNDLEPACSNSYGGLEFLENIMLPESFHSRHDATVGVVDINGFEGMEYFPLDLQDPMAGPQADRGHATTIITHLDRQQPVADASVMIDTPKLECAPLLADHLLKLFFQSVQGFLPLFHKPRLCAEIFSPHECSRSSYADISITSAILLNAMFALTARFSEWSQCWDAPPRARGAPFARKAQALWREHITDDEEPSLRLLQCRILLTFYELTSGPSFRAWQSAGICCRMAYGLSLHRTDREAGTPGLHGPAQGRDWIETEERRRAWWAVYQIDNVASIIACRPFNLDTSNMEVLLPMPDQAWFSGSPVKSALISPRGPSEAWRSLQDCENQEPYAWFLVMNELLRHAQKLWDRSDRAMEELKVLHSSLQCFALALPPSFRLTATNMAFNDDNFVTKNWIICTIILLQSAQSLVAFSLEMEQLRKSPVRSNVEECQRRLFAACDPHVNNELRALHLWSPDYIALASPLVPYGLLGPAAIHAVKRPNNKGNASREALRLLEDEILSFVLQRFAHFWPVGNVVHNLLKHIRSPLSNRNDPVGFSNVTWVQGILPVIIQSQMA